MGYNETPMKGTPMTNKALATLLVKKIVVTAAAITAVVVVTNYLDKKNAAIES